MTLDPKTAEADLAFMRAIVEDDGSHSRNFGLIYMFAGVLYSFQCFANWALMVSASEVSPLVWMAIGWGPTVLFIIVISHNSWKNRADPYGSGTTKRAVGAAFTGAGIANLILALIFGWVAYQKRDWSIWLLFPVVVCALQGAIWFATAILRRHFWYGVTAIGWFVSAMGLGVLVDQTLNYILVLGLALFAWMALPGFLILRSTQQRTSKS